MSTPASVAADGPVVDEPLHERLRQMADELGSEPVTLAALTAAHGAAVQGALLVLLAVPCSLPLPGTGTVLSLGLAAMAALLWRGPDAVCLPERVSRFALSPAAARRVLNALAWVYDWSARLLRHRWAWWTHAGHRHWMAVLVAVMAVLIFLPIPFGNVLPSAALVSLGLGLVFRDGLAVLLGAATGVGATAVFGWLGWLAWQAGQSGWALF
jgi:hypothetical protein